MDIQEIRSKYPQYSDMSDEQLASAIHQKYYSDLPYEQVAAKVLTPKAPVKKDLMTQAKERLPMGNIFSAIGEPLMKMGSSLIAKPASDIAGLAALGKEMLVGGGGDPQGFKQDVQQRLTYEPRTQVGASEYNPLNAIPAAIGSVISKGVNLVADPIQGESAADEPRGMAANAVREGLPQALSIAAAKYSPQVTSKIAEKLALAEKARKAKFVAKAPKDLNVVAAKEAGFKLPPSEAEAGRIMTSIEGVTGREKLVQNMEKFNSKRATQIIHDDLGLSEHTPLTKGAVQEVIKEAGSVYEKLKNVEKPFVADKKYLGDVANFQAKVMAAKRNNTTWNPEYAELLSDLKRSVKSPDEAVDIMKSLRAGSSANSMAVERGFVSKPNQQNLASLQKDAARIVEDLVHRSLEKRGMKDLSQEFLNARKTIAKGKTIQKVLDENGVINSEALGHLKQKGVFMSEGMEKVANFGSAFPDVAGKVSPRANVPLTSWEGMFGLGGMAAGSLVHPLGWSTLAFPASRMAGRAFLESKVGQGLVGSPAKYSPGMLSKAMEQISRMPPELQQAATYSLMMEDQK